jgi:1-phosphatidylinositol-4-phosphate 5-kinase
VKRNISVYFGHENWNLILNMMIGMRKSVKCIPPYVAQFPLSDIEFTEKALHDILPQRTSNFDYRKVFHFIDYRPSIFYRIRLMYGVTNQDYQRSIGPETMLGDLVMGRLNSLSELGSSGKSGSFFYFTQDSNINHRSR